jgi:hypothetical protein
MPDGSETISAVRRFSAKAPNPGKAEFIRRTGWLRLFGASSGIQPRRRIGNAIAESAFWTPKIVQERIGLETPLKRHVSKMPAPMGNQNRTRHGLRSTRLPDGCRYLEKATYRMREQLERECVTRFGSLDIRQAGLIQSAGRHEVRASLAARWLRVEGDRLGISDRLALLREMGNATNARDKAIEKLGLDVPASEPVDSSGRPMTAQEQVMAKLRELSPEILAEYRRQSARPQAAVPSPEALRWNGQAIEHLRNGERAEQATQSLMDESFPPSALPADLTAATPDTNGSHANGGAVPHVGSAADSVDAAGLDAGDGTEDQP